MPAFDQGSPRQEEWEPIAEAFRSFPEVLTSSHPSRSFAALGKNAHFGRRQSRSELPPGRMFSTCPRVTILDGSILLLGIGA